jgi:hypothetical protein
MVGIIPEPNASVNVLNAFSIFVQNNFILIVGFLVIVFLAMSLIKTTIKKPKIISRSEVEKLKRIKALEINENVIVENEVIDGKSIPIYSTFNHLYHGIRYLGQIINIAMREEKGNPTGETKQVMEIVFRPPMFLTVSDPFKRNLIRIYKSEMILDRSRKTIVILPQTTIDYKLGFYYDVPNEEKHYNWINETLNKTDMESNTSIYYVEGQKRSTFDFEFAQQMALKEKELQIELARKRGKLTSL